MLVVIAILVGCDQSFQRGTVGVTTYPYGPTSCAIHGLSRLSYGTGSTIYEEVVCVEFKDMDGQTTRADGLISVEFGVPDRRTEKLYDLNDRAINRECWNKTIRMYEFKHVLVPQLATAPEDGIPVRITWTPIDGKAITSEAVLKAPVR